MSGFVLRDLICYVLVSEGFNGFRLLKSEESARPGGYSLE